MTTESDTPRQPDPPDRAVGPTEEPSAPEQSTPEQSTPESSTPEPAQPEQPVATAYGAASTARPPAPRLERNSSDKMIAGVCGGLGRHTGVDPILFRIGFVALVFAAGTGFLLYLALAILMPRDTGESIWPWSRTATPGPGNGASGPAPGSAGAAGYGPPPPAVPAGPRSPVPGVTVAVLLIGFGVLALGAGLGGWTIEAEILLAVAVALVGIALLVMAFGPWRRSNAGLITLGVLLSFALFAASALDGRGGFDEATFGQTSYRPVSADQIRSNYQVLMGQSTLDLTAVDFAPTDPTEIDVDVTMGNFEIFIPRTVDLRLSGDATFGSVSVFGDRDVVDGYYPGVGEGPGVGDGDPELIIEVDVRFGNAEITRVG